MPVGPPVQLLSKYYLIRNKLVQCIGEAFGVDPLNKEQVEKLSVKPATLESIFDVYMKTRDNFGARAQSSSTSAASASTSKEPSAEDKVKADKFKQEGNSLMSGKKYDEAIEAYTKAIDLVGSNPVYYSNRAAAYSSKNDHLSAIGDAEKAIALDPSFSKGYHRLGCVQAVSYRGHAGVLIIPIPDMHSIVSAISKLLQTPSNAV